MLLLIKNKNIQKIFIMNVFTKFKTGNTDPSAVDPHAPKFPGYKNSLFA